jgi:hypothetical protein
MGITKLSEMEYHPPEQGRLRFGKKGRARNGKEIPVAIDKWRFTSPDKEAIEQVAAVYGGSVQPWNEQAAAIKNQWEVVTETSVIDCWIQPDSYDQIREEWAGGLCVRRCDGETCDLTYKSGPLRGQPCQCAQEGKDDSTACKWKTRVSLIIPQVKFGGTWRLESSSEHFAREAPGMIDMISRLQTAGLASCEVRLTWRSQVTPQGVKHFPVPQFGLPATPVQLVTGAAAIGAGTPAPQPMAALNAALDLADEINESWGVSPETLAEDLDDGEIEDAVLVEPEGWDTQEEAMAAAREHGFRVTKNFSGSGPKWVKK